MLKPIQISHGLLHKPPLFLSITVSELFKVSIQDVSILRCYYKGICIGRRMPGGGGGNLWFMRRRVAVYRLHRCGEQICNGQVQSCRVECVCNWLEKILSTTVCIHNFIYSSVCDHIDVNMAGNSWNAARLNVIVLVSLQGIMYDWKGH